MNIYAHTVSCKRKGDEATVLTCMISIAPSQGESITSVYVDIVKRWPLKLYFAHQVHTETSQQIPQEWIDRVANQ